MIKSQTLNSKCANKIEDSTILTFFWRDTLHVCNGPTITFTKPASFKIFIILIKFIKHSVQVFCFEYSRTWFVWSMLCCVRASPVCWALTAQVSFLHPQGARLVSCQLPSTNLGALVWSPVPAPSPMRLSTKPLWWVCYLMV